MSDTTIASCAAPLWDAGCRVEWKEGSDEFRLSRYSDGLFDGKFTREVYDATVGWYLPIGGIRTTHEAAVLLLHQAEVELDAATIRVVPTGTPAHTEWTWHGYNDESHGPYAIKHAAVTAAYLRMKGGDG